MIRAALHLHSTYSDGELTLEELRDALSASGHRVACLSDHAESFDEATLEKYRSESERLSNERLRFVPGLEFACDDGLHVIGYGVAARTSATNSAAVINHIRARGGVSVVAHPSESQFALIEKMKSAPDGLEVWNTKHDGRYAPRPASFDLLERLRVQRPSLLAFYGLDLHWRTQFRDFRVLLDAATPSAEHVLDALRQGQFSCTHGGTTLFACGSATAAQLARFRVVNGASRFVRRWLTRARRVAQDLGVPVPSAARAQLRRLL